MPQTATVLPFEQLAGAALDRAPAAKHALRAALAGCQGLSADRDTVCAIVGSIVVLSSGIESIPVGWLTAREPLVFGV